MHVNLLRTGLTIATHMIQVGPQTYMLVENDATASNVNFDRQMSTTVIYLKLYVSGLVLHPRNLYVQNYQVITYC